MINIRLKLSYPHSLSYYNIEYYSAFCNNLSNILYVIKKPLVYNYDNSIISK